jgi:hypothetical protein
MRQKDNPKNILKFTSLLYLPMQQYTKNTASNTTTTSTGPGQVLVVYNSALSRKPLTVLLYLPVSRNLKSLDEMDVGDV